MNKFDKYYLKKGKLELSILDEDAYGNQLEEISSGGEKEAPKSKGIRGKEPRVKLTQDIYNVLQTMGEFLTKPESESEKAASSVKAQKLEKIASSFKVQEIELPPRETSLSNSESAKIKEEPIAEVKEEKTAEIQQKPLIDVQEDRDKTCKADSNEEATTQNTELQGIKSVQQESSYDVSEKLAGGMEETLTYAQLQETEKALQDYEQLQDDDLEKVEESDAYDENEYAYPEEDDTYDEWEEYTYQTEEPQASKTDEGIVADYHNNHQTEGYDIEDYSTEDYSTEDYSTEDYSTEDYSTEDYSAEDYSAEDHSTENYSTEDYNAEDYSTEDYSTEDYSTEDYSAEGYSAENYSIEDYNAEDYSAEDYSVEDYNAEDYSVEGYSAEGYSTEDYSAEGYGTEDYSAEDYSAEDYSAEGYGTEDYNTEDDREEKEGLGDYAYDEEQQEDILAAYAYHEEASNEDERPIGQVYSNHVIDESTYYNSDKEISNQIENDDEPSTHETGLKRFKHALLMDEDREDETKMIYQQAANEIEELYHSNEIVKTEEAAEAEKNLYTGDRRSYLFEEDMVPSDRELQQSSIDELLKSHFGRVTPKYDQAEELRRRINKQIDAINNYEAN